MKCQTVYKTEELIKRIEELDEYVKSYSNLSYEIIVKQNSKKILVKYKALAYDIGYILGAEKADVRVRKIKKVTDIDSTKKLKHIISDLMSINLNECEDRIQERIQIVNSKAILNRRQLANLMNIGEYYLQYNQINELKYIIIDNLSDKEKIKLTKEKYSALNYNLEILLNKDNIETIQMSKDFFTIQEYYPKDTILKSIYNDRVPEDGEYIFCLDCNTVGHISSEVRGDIRIKSDDDYLYILDVDNRECAFLPHEKITRLNIENVDLLKNLGDYISISGGAYLDFNEGCLTIKKERK